MTAAITVPAWHKFMLPILQVLADGHTRQRRDLRVAVFAHMALTEEQLAERLGRGDSRAENRFGWALSDLVKVDAVHRPARAQSQITDLGRTLITTFPDGISERDLKSLPSYHTEGAGDLKVVAAQSSITSELSPVEQMDLAEKQLHAVIGSDLIDRLHAQPPDFLERAILELLVSMGYGGTEGVAQHIGGSADGGVDGVIAQDALGLDKVYVQAKRYARDNKVQRQEVQGFAGALLDKGANRGIFITTSSFTQRARDYAESISGSAVGNRIVLIDGDRLAALMIKYGVGVQTVRTFTVVDIDEDYFE